MAYCMMRKDCRHAAVEAPRRAPAVARVVRLASLSLRKASPCSSVRAVDPKQAAAPTETLAEPSSSVQATAAGAAAAAAAAAPVAAPAQPWVWEDSNDAVRAYAVFFLWLALGSWPALQEVGLVDLPYFLGLGVLTVYIGAHRGLTSKSKQQLSVKEGLLAPVLASCSLFGLYLLVKYIPDFSLQTFLDAYFWLLGSVAIYGAARPLLRQLAPGTLGQKSIEWQPPEGLLLDEEGNNVPLVQVAPSDVAAAAFAVGLASAELLGHHTSFTLNNMVACLVATEILALVGLRSFRTAALLLVGLLAYDVFWVFGSPAVVGDNVMLTVATSDMIVGPTRLLFPRAPGGIGEAADFPFSLLGLGDIAIPGLLAGLALRYDASRIVNMQARATAAAAAISEALAALQPDASAKEMGDAAASAASTAYDKVADKELNQQDKSQGITRAISSDSSSSSSSSSDTSSSNTISSSSDTTTSSSSSSSIQEQQRSVPVSIEVLQQRTYFTRVACAHVAGLLTAFAANSITHMGQPALLYIVPATLLTVLVTAASRSEVGRVWKYTDVASFGLPVKKE
ncbi:hypothetical protein OEZ86_014409 [Tetradesmus obliquus]|nr:hypothetical protein OEZ86_014409 [Tetradesmus obliquus]